MITLAQLQQSQSRRCLVEGRPARIIDWWDEDGYGVRTPIRIRVLETEGLRRYDRANDDQIVILPDWRRPRA